MIKFKYLTLKINLILLLLAAHSLCVAHTLGIQGNKLLTIPTTYKNITLDLRKGNFTIDHDVPIIIEDSTIQVNISPENPHFILLKNGILILKNNIINVTVNDLPQTPTTQSLYALIHVEQGKVNIQNNNFTVDKFYCLSLFITNEDFTTTDFIVRNNKINNFHGGLYLIHSNNADISHNFFSRVSYGNIFNLGNNNKFVGNIFSLAGNLSLGDSIDIVDSENTLIKENFIGGDSCYGIQILNSKNLVIDNNYISNGITYGISIDSMNANIKDEFLLRLKTKHILQDKENENILIINNYFSQNRFAIKGDSIDGLTIANNIFIQKFNDASSRMFWTNNDNLFKNVKNMSWKDNKYKEAFSQEVYGNNKQALQLINFPARGGVILPNN